MWGLSLFKITSLESVLYGTKWLFRRHYVQNPALYSKRRIAEAIINKGSTIDHCSSRCKGREGPPLVHSFIHGLKLCGRVLKQIQYVCIKCADTPYILWRNVSCFEICPSDKTTPHHSSKVHERYLSLYALILSRSMCDYERDFVQLGLLAIYRSQLQTTITLYRTLQDTLSLFQPAISSIDVSWQQLQQWLFLCFRAQVLSERRLLSNWALSLTDSRPKLTWLPLLPSL
jgi:hypothetical protein